MNTPPFSREEEVFSAVVNLSPDERSAYLDARYGDDSQSRARMEQLIASHEAGDFMSAMSTSIDLEIETQFAWLKPEDEGEQIGNYRLIEEIGGGGFGTVWLAEQQQPLKRKVALKIIKLGMDTREVIDRFEQERQALAVMDHPNIAKVFDAGATRYGRPFFVMELVQGKRITDYCDDAKLPVRERLRLFIEVCQAVQHAHQKGIIHRDLKPSNILVTFQDGVALPKVIDFGVAKAMHGRLTDATIATEMEQMVGTPLYMSPEQADRSGVDIDTRSDIFSLGVLLYELLVGRTPVTREDMRNAGNREMRRLICEIEPEKPSIVLQLMSKSSAGTVAEKRQSDPAKLVRYLRSDLDWIVIKTLEKDRRRRYETANGLSLDIQRFLADQPVSAGPPGAGYRLGKLVRRNKAAVAAGSAVAGAVFLGIIGTLWQAHRANEYADAMNRAASLAISETARAKAQVREASRSDFATAQLRLVEGKWQEGVAYLARAIRYDPDNHLAQEALLMTLLNGRRDAGRLPIREFKHSGLGSRAVFSEDGSRVVMLISKTTAQVWNAETGEPLGESLQHPGAVSKLRFSPDGSRVLTVGLRADNADTSHAVSGLAEEAQVWDAETGKPVGAALKPGMEITEAQFSPNGSWLVTASPDNSARVWNARNGEQMGPAFPHESMIFGVAISPDGLRFLTFTLKTLRIWNIQSGQIIGAPHQHQGIILNAVFSPDSSRVMSAEREGTAYLWDAASSQLVGAPLHHSREIGIVGFGPDSSRVLTAGDGELRIWDPNTGGLICKTQRQDRQITTAILSPDGSRVITASTTWDSAQIWDADNGHPIGVALQHSGGIDDASFSSDGARAITASADMTARVWDVRTGQLIGVPFQHDGPVRRARFGPDGSRVMTVGDDKVMRLWNAKWDIPVGVVLGSGGNASFSSDSTRVLTVSRDHMAQIWNAESGHPVGGPLRHADLSRAIFSPDGSRAVTYSDGIAQLWNAQSSQPIGVPLQHRERVEFSPDSRRMITIGFDWSARIWNTSTGRPIGLPIQHEGAIRSASFSPDSSKVVTCSADETAGIWNAWTGEPIGKPLMQKGTVVLARFSPDGDRVVTVTRDAAQLWNVQTGEPIGDPLQHGRDRSLFEVLFDGSETRLLTVSKQDARVWDARTARLSGPPLLHKDKIRRAGISPDGSRIVTVTEQIARLWDTRTARSIGTLIRHSGSVHSAHFSPDGSRLISASRDRTTRIWNTSTGQPIGPPLFHAGGVNSAHFSPDGSRVIAGSYDGTARIWDTPRPMMVSAEVAAALAEFCAGAKLDPGLGVLHQASVGERMEIWRSLESALTDRPAMRFAARQTFPRENTTSPIALSSTMTIRMAATRLLEVHQPAHVDTVLHMDPAHPLLPFALAAVDGSNRKRADWLCSYGFNRLPRDLTPAELRLGARLLEKMGDQKSKVLALLDRARDEAPEDIETKALRARNDGTEKVRIAAARRAKDSFASAVKGLQFEKAIEVARDMVEDHSEDVASSTDPEPDALLASALLLYAHSEAGRRTPEKAVTATREAGIVLQRLAARKVPLEIAMSRVDLFSRHGQWDEALAFCQSAYESAPLSDWAAFRLGLLLVKMDQSEPYERLCRELLRSTLSTEYTPSEFRPLPTQDVVVMTICLRPLGQRELPSIRAMDAQAAWRAIDSQPNRSWFMMTKMLTHALVEYRAGKHAEVLAKLGSSIPQMTMAGKASACAVLALAKLHTNRRDEAHADLREGEMLFRENWFSNSRVVLEGNPHDWLLADILLREARLLFEGRN